MAFKVAYTKRFSREFKALSAQLKEAVLKTADQIQAEPGVGKQTDNDWKVCRVYYYDDLDSCRILYRVYSRCKDNGNHVCKFEDVKHTDEEFESCEGLIEFFRVGTKESMNKLYS